jgi:hypothetical protein
MKAYIKLVMIMEFVVNFATSKSMQSEVQCSHIKTYINILGVSDGKTHNRMDQILIDR